MPFIRNTSIQLVPRKDVENYDHLEAVVALLTKYSDQDYFAYERGDVWHVGLGSHASLRINPSGEVALMKREGKEDVIPITGPLEDVARTFASEFKRSAKMFGHVGFNYGAHVRGQSYFPGRWDLMSIMVPITEVIIEPHYITVRGHSDEQMDEVCKFLKSTVTHVYHVSPPRPVNTQQKEDEYKTLVTEALADIRADEYTKIIVSRAINLSDRVDMPSTLLHGRRHNTPARTFIMNHAGFQAVGFSPELVISVHNGTVLTEPLAGTRGFVGTKEGNLTKDLTGTRQFVGTKEENDKLRNTLVNDPKEIVEHVISVKEAILELNGLCDPETVAVKDLMCVKERGSVQHLGSTVLGQLYPKTDAWAALNVLFPSITAAGIPKNIALEAIERLETRPRELYSGAVMLIDGKGDVFEATLCLRTLFQDSHGAWIQAGAGITSQSNPERELTETAEKLASVAPYIVYSGTSSA